MDWIYLMASSGNAQHEQEIQQPQIPSLKRDSPEILVLRLGEAPAVFIIPKTAIGSVGEIRAPKR